MKHYRLKQEERAGIGFTDLFIVTHADFTTTTDDAAQSITLCTLAVGDLVMNNALLEVRTNANVVAAVTGSLGVTGSVAAIIAASNLLAAGTEYYTVASTVGPYITTSAVDLLFTADPGATDNVDEMTRVAVWIWVTSNRRGERNVQV